MKNQLRGIALVIFAVLIVVICIAMTPGYATIFEEIMTIISGFIGFIGVALTFMDETEENKK